MHSATPSGVEAISRDLARNAIGLYAAYAGNILAPIVTIPYLARVLGPEAWGTLAAAQAFGFYLYGVVNYGFDWSATREVARYRVSQDNLAEIVRGMLGARLLLVAGACVSCALLQGVLPNLGSHRLLFWAAIFEALARSVTPMWYFQGL